MSDERDSTRPTDELRDRRWIALAREHFNPPPAVPSEEMWAAIEGVLREESSGEPEAASDETLPMSLEPVGPGDSPEPADPSAIRPPARWNTPRWSWAAAAVLVLTTGVIVGRWSAGPVPPGTAVTVSADDQSGGAFPSAPAETRVASSTLQRAAVEHLDRTEAFLVGVRADAGRGGVDPSVSAWAADLLMETRLLLDSPAASDPGIAGLLRDLEWILVQVNALPNELDRRTEELQLLTDGMDQQDVLFRLRAQAPVQGYSAM